MPCTSAHTHARMHTCVYTIHRYTHTIINKTLKTKFNQMSNFSCQSSTQCWAQFYPLFIRTKPLFVCMAISPIVAESHCTMSRCMISACVYSLDRHIGSVCLSITAAIAQRAKPISVRNQPSNSRKLLYKAVPMSCCIINVCTLWKHTWNTHYPELRG